MNQMREWTLLALAALAAVLFAAAPAHAARADIVQVGHPKFPERAYVLTLPAGVTPEPSEIAVSENGDPVTLTEAAPFGDRSDFGVVLAIDTSHSMVGEPIADAMAAAREFADQRPRAQRIGVVTFNRSTTTVLGPTNNSAAIDAALASTPKLAAGTNLYDAAAAGLELLRNGGSATGAVIVLSDGADSGSIATASRVADAAERTNARIFTIGVRSRSYNSATLTELAKATRGSYLGAASGAALSTLYRELGAQLANAYLVRYRSSAASGSDVRVEAQAGGLRAQTRYSVPALAVDGSTTRETPFLASKPGIAVVSAVTLLAVFLLLTNLFNGGRRGPTVSQRIGAYGDTPLSDAPELEAPKEGGRLRASARLVALAESLELACIDMAPERFALMVFAAGVLLAWVLSALAGSVLLAPVGLLLAVLGARAAVRSRISRQRSQFADELADSLQAVASAMRAGHSFAAALAVMSEEAGPRTATEFGRVIADERLGVPLEEAFQQTIRRMKNSDLEQVALVAILQRETGGNGAEALDRVVENLRGREDVRRLVRSLTAQGQMSRWVLTALPIVLLLVIAVISPGYADPLWSTTLGNVLVALGAAFVFAGSAAINRIVKIEV